MQFHNLAKWFIMLFQRSIEYHFQYYVRGYFQDVKTVWIEPFGKLI